MTSGLFDALAQRIRATGPIRVDEFMAEALGHPTLGYYTRQDPLGRGGDFITAPEISQIFGELIGLWSACVWQSISSPAPVRIVELGPGRGTLMADLLRAASQVPGLIPAVEVHLVETSPVLRDAQRATLAALGVVPAWHDRLDGVPEGPMVLIANEFFDALPIRQLVKTNNGWGERQIALNEAQDAFTFVARPNMAVAAMIPEHLRAAPTGAIFEVCPQGIAIADQIGRRLTQHPGAALVIDYGHSLTAIGDTLQAVKDHAYAAALESPGDADLTAHVDFDALSRAVRESGADAYAPLTQGEFLLRLGLAQRAEALMNAGDAQQAESIERQAHRLVAPDAMGELFKVATWTAPGQIQPPGFEDQG